MVEDQIGDLDCHCFRDTSTQLYFRLARTYLSVSDCQFEPISFRHCEVPIQIQPQFILNEEPFPFILFVKPIE